MEYYVRSEAAAPGRGTKEQPFPTIQQAAELAEAGDTIWIGEGIYREWVRPVHGGTDEAHRIVYESMPGERAIISGAEELTDWVCLGDDIWRTVIPAAMLKDYNPYDDCIYGDWYDDFGQVHHTGEIYMDDMALYECPDVKLVKKDGGWTAIVSERETEIRIHVPGINPNEHRMEASIRPCCFFPDQEGRSYITVSGLIIEKAATQWAPPTAFQPGAIGPHWSRGWIIENCTIRHSKCVGISLGKRHNRKDNIWSLDPRKGGAQTYTEMVFENLRNGWSKDMVGGHRLLKNVICDCGQAGVVGCMGGAFSTISGNHIYNINTRGEFGGAEMAGIKLHGAIDAVIEGNQIHDCIRGLWLDWEAQGARVSGNAFFENVEEDVFIEVCHGPCMIDNNLLLSPCSLLNVSQGTALVHNLFAGKIRLEREPNRFTMYHAPHDTAVAGMMIIYGGDDKICHNLYIGRHGEEGYGNVVYNGYPDRNVLSDTSKDDRPMAYANQALPVDIHDNLYLNGAQGYEHERNAIEDCFHAEIEVLRRDGRYAIKTNLADCPHVANLPIVTTSMLGTSFESEATYENADGTPIVLSVDYAGHDRGHAALPGPFADFPLCLEL